MDFYYDEIGPKCAVSVITSGSFAKVFVPDYLEHSKIEAWLSKAVGKFEKDEECYKIDFNNDTNWLLYYYYPFFLE